MKGLLYTLTLEEPVLANSLGGEPNSANSLFYIPGGLVRGAAINAYKGKKEASDGDFRRLFLDGRTCYLNAYPLAAGQRSLPAPFTWQVPHHPKQGQEKTIYFTREQVPTNQETRNVPFGFWVQEGNKIGGLEETWQVNVHTRRDAVKGRAIPDAGAVYRYIALPAGMQFQGAILTEDIATIETLLNGKTFRLGKARTAGYGRAKFKTSTLPEDWSETGKLLQATSGKFTLTLLSPALVSDRNGQFSLDIGPALTDRLGDGLVIKERYCKPVIVGGFNRTWGLPLPQVTAIAAGSVFVVEAEVPVDRLSMLEGTGLGDRRAEGFGRVAVNLPLPETVRWEHIKAELAVQPAPQNKLGQDATAQLMLKRLLQRDLDARVLHVAREAVSIYAKDKVPNSQLSRWRVILRDALGKRAGEDPVVRMKKFCVESQGKPGWQKMEKARIKIGETHPRLTEWIESVLESPEALYTALKVDPGYGMTIGSNSIRIESWNDEYRLRLLDAVLALMEKMNSEGGVHGQ